MTVRLQLLTAIQEAADMVELFGIDLAPAWKRRDKREPGRREKEAAEDALMLWVRRHFRKQEKRIRARLELQPPAQKALKYSDDQPRDEVGRWTDGGGGDSGGGDSGDNSVSSGGVSRPGATGNPVNKRYQDAYNKAKQARENGVTDMRTYSRENWMDMDRASFTEIVMMEAGLRGAEMPYEVTGWRYGDIPESGQSWNYKEGVFEAGVSMMAIDNGGPQTQDMFSAAHVSNRPVVRVRGLLHTFKMGGDGEPLLLDAVKIK